MAKTIKFPLKLKDDFPVRSVEELRQHFDLNKIIGYFLDGKLLSWLESRYYDTEAEAVKTLDKNDNAIKSKLCAIFGVEQTDDSIIDVLSIEEKNKRLAILRQYTSDENILNKIEQVAFNQEDLTNILDDNDSHDIYLCNNSFVIPLNVNDKNYIGFGTVEIIVHSDKIIDFNSKNIKFFNIHFDSAYDNIVNHENPELFYKCGIKAENRGDYNSAFVFFKKSADLNYVKAVTKVGDYYNPSTNYRHCVVKGDVLKAIEWYQKAVNLGSIDAMLKLGNVYLNRLGDYKKSTELYTKAANSGSIKAMKILGALCDKEWFHKAINSLTKNANLDDTTAMCEIAEIFWNNLEDKYKSINWYEQAIKLGDNEAALSLALLYTTKYDPTSSYFYRGIEIYRKLANTGNSIAMLHIAYYYLNKRDDNGSALSWFTKSANLGNVDSMMAIGTIFSNQEWFNKAINELRKKADLNDVYAICRIASMYSDHYCKLKNYNKAIEWYQKATKLGDTEAMRKIALIYEHLKNKSKVIEWYKKAADLGDPESMKSLGYIFEELNDKLNALEWFQKAIDSYCLDRNYVMRRISKLKN